MQRKQEKAIVPQVDVGSRQSKIITPVAFTGCKRTYKSVLIHKSGLEITLQ
jgi:hypothetical protein